MEVAASYALAVAAGAALTKAYGWVRGGSEKPASSEVQKSTNSPSADSKPDFTATAKARSLSITDVDQFRDEILKRRQSLRKVSLVPIKTPDYNEIHQAIQKKFAQVNTEEASENPVSKPTSDC